MTKNIAILLLLVAVCLEGFYAYRLAQAFNTVAQSNNSLYVGLMVCLKLAPNPLEQK